MQQNKKKKKQHDVHRAVREPPFLPLVRVILFDLLFVLFFRSSWKENKRTKKEHHQTDRQRHQNQSTRGQERNQA